MSPVIAIVLIGIGAVLLVVIVPRWLQLRRAEFIRTYRWPAGLLERLEKHRPSLERKNSALVSRGLRQFFIAYLMSGKRYVSMPSQVADDLWHEFILYTREYDAFSRRAFGGFLHHTPRWCCQSIARATRVFVACGGTVANTRTSTRSTRPACRFCSRWIPS
jgi:hypothetical protein